MGTNRGYHCIHKVSSRRQCNVYRTETETKRYGTSVRMLVTIETSMRVIRTDSEWLSYTSKI